MSVGSIQDGASSVSSSMEGLESSRSSEMDNESLSHYALVQSIQSVVATVLTSAHSTLLNESTTTASQVSYESSSFTNIWTELQKATVLQDQKLADLLYSEIAKRREELLEQKEHWFPYINLRQEAFSDMLDTFHATLASGTIVEAEEGAGSAHFLKDQEGNILFVIKPVANDIFCVDNSKKFALPFNNELMRVRSNIPLYRSAQTDSLCYLIAEDLGIGFITPRTCLSIVDSSAFYDLTKGFTGKKAEILIEKTGPVDTQKLCSLQEFVPQAIPMADVIYQWLDAGYSDEQMAERLDKDDFEMVNLFTWITHDTDAHFNNFLVYVKSTDATGSPIYGIRKIDNGLSFPESNAHYMNLLMHFHNAKAPLSQKAREKILTLPVEKMGDHIKMLELESTLDAFYQRIFLLQTLVKEKPEITLYEISLRLSTLEKENGMEIALGNQSIEELEALVSSSDESLYSSSSSTTTISTV